MVCEHENTDDITTTGSVADIEWCRDCGAVRFNQGDWTLPDNSDPVELQKLRADLGAAELDRDKWHNAAERQRDVISKILDAISDELEEAGDDD